MEQHPKTSTVVKHNDSQRQSYWWLTNVRCKGCISKLNQAFSQQDSQAQLKVTLAREFDEGKVADAAERQSGESHLQVETKLSEPAQTDIFQQLQHDFRPASALAEQRADQLEVAESGAPGTATPDASLQPNPENTAAADIQLAITGMSCAGCVNSVRKALSSVEGVSDAQVNFASHTASIELLAEVSQEDQQRQQLIEQLVHSVDAVGYGAELVEDPEVAEQQREARQQQTYRRRVQNTWLALGVSVPLMAYGLIFGMSMATPMARLAWILVGLLTLVVMIRAGGHFFTGAYKAGRHGNANMDTLIALGTGAAWLYSMVVVLAPELFPVAARGIYFEAAAMIIGLINLGQSLELKAKGRTNEAIKRLLSLRSKTAHRLQDDREEEVPIEQLEVGDLIRVRPGEQIPVDGEIVEGRSLVDESMLTGEPVAISKAGGDMLSAGTLNSSGSLVFRATKVGRETALAQIIQLVQRAQNSKPAISQLADRVSAVFVPVVILIALVTAFTWYLIGPDPKLTHMLVAACTVLIIACPCALGLATPISIMISVGKAAERGILVRNGDALQQASRLDVMILDKTGTITEGQPSVVDAAFWGALPQTQVLSLARAIEDQSEHPLAEAVVRYVDEQVEQQTAELPTLSFSHFQSLTGLGVEATTTEGQQLLFGNHRLMQQSGIALGAAEAQIGDWQQDARTVIFFAVEGELAACLAVADPIKADAVEAIAGMHRAGLKVVMLTGDNRFTAAAVASETGIDDFRAELMPEDKLAFIRDCQQQGQHVGMVGDGINDAPALSQADVGFAIGSGTDVAIESADITLMRGSLLGVADAVALSQATLKNIKQNLWGAFAYNSLGIPVAAGVLYPFTGLLLNPVIAGLAMSLSSVTVVSNANRLRFWRPES